MTVDEEATPDDVAAAWLLDEPVRSGPLQTAASAGADADWTTAETDTPARPTAPAAAETAATDWTPTRGAAPVATATLDTQLPARGRGRQVLAGIAVLVVALGGAFLALRGSDDGASAPARTTAASTAPTATVQPTRERAKQPTPGAARAKARARVRRRRQAARARARARKALQAVTGRPAAAAPTVAPTVAPAATSAPAVVVTAAPAPAPARTAAPRPQATAAPTQAPPSQDPTGRVP